MNRLTRWPRVSVAVQEDAADNLLVTH
ncbi:hypothetical protein BCAR13_640022 [Paraburkholderia caribensis]|nr:hypothetical protein BCAR13_640022 [Paraburkholderia caribensis]